VGPRRGKIQRNHTRDQEKEESNEHHRVHEGHPGHEEATVIIENRIDKEAIKTRRT